MRKYILFFLIISVVPVLFAQVGVNTTSPAGVFHIDPNKNSPTTVTDDVVVDVTGNMGLGTLSPAAKVHIAVPAGNVAFRMTDGSQAADRILMSDASGNASWGVIKGSGGYTMKVTAAKTFPNAAATLMPLDGSNTQINIVSAGNYLVTIRWSGTTTTIGASGAVSAYFYLRKNGSNVDAIEYYVPATANTPFAFTTMLMATNCVPGNYLQVYVTPSVGGQPWVINGSGTVNPSIVVFRM
ncbi:hypothetical protein [Dysgonomonas alginatilytica]|nr:hypothetical protein [Dysgonomonas alginatilytica]